MPFFTIGYGGREKDEFLGLLRAHKVKTIVDIRLRPDRGSMGMWTKAKTPDKGIEAILSEASIGYRPFVELGNVFLDLPNWQPLYRELIEAAGELLTRRLVDVPGPYCLLCACKRVAECHRLPVAEFLAKRDRVKVVHIE